MTTAPLRLGISHCLLGEEVRFDGGHKRDNFLTEVLGSYVEWVPICPEVEAGLLLSVIGDYHHGLMPLIVPLTLIKHYVQIFDVSYIRDQVYLNPHPIEVMLRNHV